MTGRADPFAGSDDLDDLSDFASPAARPKIDARAVREVSEKHKFPSRAAPAQTESPIKPQPRRRRTGRSHQLNLKVTAETAARFNDIADRYGWGLGETFEAALEALERSLPALSIKS